MTKNISIIILAAGKGTRMKSELPKVMHKVAGREMLNMVIDTAKKSNPKNISIVISEEMERFKEKIIQTHPEIKISFVIQKERKGTAHAVQTGLSALDKIAEKVVILYGDTPLISSQIIEKMIEKINKSALCVLGFHCFEENGYGRLVIDQEGHLARIVERKDSNDEEKKITLCNSGVVAVKGEQIESLLQQVKNENAAGEFYLTDIVGIANNNSLKSSFIETKEEEVLGVNSRVELAKVETIKQNQIRKEMMESGVTLLDPNSVYFSFDTKIAAETIIHPQVFFGQNVEIASNVEIRSFSHIEGAKIGAKSVIGPFARIRPETEIGEEVRIGNFVEVKKSKIKKGAKVNHLSYVGDSYVDELANIGAGTVTCNYDGYNKFKTRIGKNVFIGSNSSLVAPVEIADGAVVGAGSVITEDVLKDELAIARSKQTNISDGGKSYHRNKSKK
jgi:bifunctional UDP-N-acetylglucosamine pyrophosphorylase / glucosamine-1-phosphate N-acetyltransferase